MPLTASQIVSTALQISGTGTLDGSGNPAGYTVQAGQALNSVLRELAYTYNLEVARKTTSVLLDSSVGNPAGGGPFPLPSDYLRIASNEAIYLIDNVPQVMINVDLQEYDSLSKQPGLQNYPEYFATDTSGGSSNSVMYVWPPSGGNYFAQVRYWSLPPDISSPETSNVYPWFPYDNYLIQKVAGMLMMLANDDRYAMYLGEGPEGAQGMLRRYLNLQSDDESRAQVVEFDRRYFGPTFDDLPNTKTIGWG